MFLSHILEKYFYIYYFLNITREFSDMYLVTAKQFLVVLLLFLEKFSDNNTRNSV